MAAGFPTSCVLCHDETAWIPSTFDHDNAWPLVGAHTSITCASCHGNFSSDPPTTCFGCHQNDYNSTNDPPHLSMGFPTQCTDCHNQIEWGQVNFEHDDDYFPIFGGAHEDELREPAPSTRGPEWTHLWCIGCHASGIAE